LTADVILITAFLSLVAAAGAAYRSWQNSKRIAEVHVIMNSRMTDALSRIEQLTQALQKVGVVVPHDPSLKTLPNIDASDGSSKD
jgi:hypothetical protein